MTLTGLIGTVTALGGQCGPSTDGGFSVSFQPPPNSIAGGVGIFGASIKLFHGAGDYPLAATGPNYGILGLISDTRMATSGTMTVASDEKSGSIKADFEGGIHMEAKFTC